jgi:hypothetical protein
MNRDFGTRFLTGIVLVTVFAIPFIWAGLRSGYFAHLTRSGLWQHGIGIAAIIVALAAGIAAFMTWLADQNATAQDDRSRPRS